MKRMIACMLTSLFIIVATTMALAEDEKGVFRYYSSSTEDETVLEISSILASTGNEQSTAVDNALLPMTGDIVHNEYVDPQTYYGDDDLDIDGMTGNESRVVAVGADWLIAWDGGSSVKSWSSSDKKILSVEDHGVWARIRALKVGKAKAVVKLKNGKKKYLTVKVIDPYVPWEVIIYHDGYEIVDRSTKKIPVGCAWALDAEVLYDPYYVDDGGDQTVTWKSSNSKVASITSYGRILAKKMGKTTITATGKDKVKCQFTLKVVENKTPNMSPSRGQNLVQQVRDGYVDSALAELKSIEIVSPSKIVVEMYMYNPRKKTMKYNDRASLDIYHSNQYGVIDTHVARMNYPKTLRIDLKPNKLKVIKITLSGNEVFDTNYDLREVYRSMSCTYGGNVFQ